MAKQPLVPRGTDVQGNLNRMVREREGNLERQHHIADRIEILFRESSIIPSLKHPAEIVAAVRGHLERGEWLDNKRLLAIVDNHLAKDPMYWNATRVWEVRREAHERSAFSRPLDVIKLLDFRFPQYKSKIMGKN